MAREFDMLESEDRRRARSLYGDYLHNLQETRGRGAPPPGNRIRDLRPQDPSVDSFEQRFHGTPSYERSVPVVPGRRERFLDPTKVISDAEELPPSLNKPMAQATPTRQLPPGFSYEAPTEEPKKGLPEGYSYEEPRAPSPPPEDPFERAAMRTGQSVAPVGGRREGTVTQALGTPAQAIGRGASRAVDVIERGLDKVIYEGADPVADIAKSVVASGRAGMQSTFVNRLGRSSSGEFDPETWAKNYSGLSTSSKNAMFGRGSDSLRFHLDSIEGVTQRGYDPLGTLSRIVPKGTVGKGLSEPAGAASIAQWSRAYERALRAKNGPQSIASLRIATRNLNNTLGANVMLSDILNAPENVEE